MKLLSYIQITRKIWREAMMKKFLTRIRPEIWCWPKRLSTRIRKYNTANKLKIRKKASLLFSWEMPFQLQRLRSFFQLVRKEPDLTRGRPIIQIGVFSTLGNRLEK